jgi:hypothetical protein
MKSIDLILEKCAAKSGVRQILIATRRTEIRRVVRYKCKTPASRARTERLQVRLKHDRIGKGVLVVVVTRRLPPQSSFGRPNLHAVSRFDNRRLSKQLVDTLEDGFGNPADQRNLVI